MAPLPSSKSPCRVHLTGFGPFKKILINPSWTAIQHLGGTTLHSPPPLPPLSSPTSTSPPSPPLAKEGDRPIIFSVERIATSYSEVLAKVPLLHPSSDLTSDDEPPYDLIIHVGVGYPGRIVLESQSFRWGYNSLDVDSLPGPLDPVSGRRGFVGEEWDGVCDDVVQGGVWEEGDVGGTKGGEGGERIRGIVKREKVVEALGGRVGLSDDAGRYLCGFIFFCSLACSIRREREGRKRVPVLFVHIPSVDEPHSLADLTQITQGIAWAIVNEGGLDA